MTTVEALPFQASWPASLDPELRTGDQRAYAITVFVLKIIFIPFYAVYLAARFVVSVIILPAYLREKADFSKERLAFEKKLIQTKKASIHSFSTPDGEVLEGTWIGKEKSEKVVLIPMPNSALFENWATGYLRELDKINASIFLFNYRGVGNSTGTPYLDCLPLDVYSAYEYLVSQNYQTENIVIYGYSMGGASGTLGASLIQEKYKTSPVVFADCTFSSLSGCVNAFVEEKTISLLGSIVGWLIRALDLDLRVQEAWKTLKNKRHCYYNTTDPVILEKSALKEGSSVHHFANPDHVSMCGSPTLIQHLNKALLDS